MERKPPIRKSPAKPSTTTKKPTKRVAPAKDKPAARKVKEGAAQTPAALRRAIFIDVENTSSEADLSRVLEHLKIDRVAQPTELTAVGNWRAVGARTARLLAGLGVHLVHSAPALGVRDWSDLWIAVAAGKWLGTARAGETLEIVSDDRAFDAVADSAAALGVTFRRTSYRSIPGTAERAATQPARRRRRRGRAGASRPHERPPGAPAQRPAVVSAAPAPAVRRESEDEAHAASQEQIRAALARLSGGDVTRWISLDALANTLKAEGFTRPPGSPRLIVRLRRIKNVEVTPNGLVRLLGDSAETQSESASPPPAGTPRRPRRRGGRRHRHRNEANGNVVPEATGDPTES